MVCKGWNEYFLLLLIIHSLPQKLSQAFFFFLIPKKQIHTSKVVENLLENVSCKICTYFSEYPYMLNRLNIILI